MLARKRCHTSLEGQAQVTVAADSGGITGAPRTEPSSYDRFGFSTGGSGCCKCKLRQRRPDEKQARAAEAGATQTLPIVRLLCVRNVFCDGGGYFSGVG